MPMRLQYWSCTKFAHWLRRKLGAPETPESASGEEWDQWRRESKKHRLAHWLTEEALDAVQNFVNYPTDVLNKVRAYVKNRFSDKMHYLSTRLKKGQYYDVDTRLLHGLFETLVDFVEIEKAHMQLICGDGPRPFRYRWWGLRWMSYRSRELGMKHLEWEITLDSPELDEYQASPIQAQTAREIIALYTWWKDIYPNRVDPYDASGWSELCATLREPGDTFIRESKTDAEQETIRECLDRCRTIEKQYDDEEEQMMIRMIKIRKSLWT